MLLYAGTILWVIGYDTIYALQDIEDDALVGVKSTARLFWRTCEAGRRHALCRRLRAVECGGIVGRQRHRLCGSLSLLAAALMAWQVWTVDAAEPDNPRSRFYSNHYVGIILALALLAEWVSGNRIPGHNAKRAARTPGRPF